jgi:competence protein ComEA
MADVTGAVQHRGTIAHYRGYVTIVLLNLTALGVVVWLLRDPRADAVQIRPAPTPTPAPTATAVLLAVHVSGAVVSPGVVDLPQDARAEDAVQAAGGFAPDADRSGVNLAQRLSDGQQLHVPAQGEGPVAVSVPQGADSAAPGEAAGDAVGTVNVNQATAQQLQALPGIGPALAERIVAYRDESGPFASPEDLLGVRGIGPKTLERFLDRITVR